MSDVESRDARPSTTSTEDASAGTPAAIESFVGRNTLRGRYFLLAIAIAVLWWLTFGPMSA